MYFGHTHSRWKFPGKGSNPHSWDLHHSSGNADSLTHSWVWGLNLCPSTPEIPQSCCTTVGTPTFYFRYVE